MSNLVFSVIVPTYNRSALLPECIASLRAQTCPQEAYEIIVVDNNSTDDTAKVVQRLNEEPGKEVRYVLEKRPGLMEGRHAGARAAKGEILAYTDDDGVADSGWLSALAKAYEALNPDLAGGKILIRWDRQPPDWVIPYEGTLAKIDRGPAMRLLEPGEEIYGPNFSIKRERLFQIGGFNPDQFGDWLAGDGETGLCQKVHSAGWRIAWVPDALVWHVQFVAKNATLADLKRRYANNGVGSVYAKYKKGDLTMESLAIFARRAQVRSLKLKLKALLHFANRGPFYYKYKLQEAHLQAQANCALRLVRDPEYRQFVLRNDWINVECSGV